MLLPWEPLRLNHEMNQRPKGIEAKLFFRGAVGRAGRKLSSSARFKRLPSMDLQRPIRQGTADSSQKGNSDASGYDGASKVRRAERATATSATRTLDVKTTKHSGPPSPNQPHGHADMKLQSAEKDAAGHGDELHRIEWDIMRRHQPKIQRSQASRKRRRLEPPRISEHGVHDSLAGNQGHIILEALWAATKHTRLRFLRLQRNSHVNCWPLHMRGTGQHPNKRLIEEDLQMAGDLDGSTLILLFPFDKLRGWRQSSRDLFHFPSSFSFPHPKFEVSHEILHKSH